MKAYDVAVAGGGNAGLCAALSAAECGARVILFERSPKWRRGGNSRHTRDIRYAHDQSDPWAKTAYPASAFAEDLRSVSDHIADPALVNLMIESSPSLPAWMESHGVHWQQPMNGALSLSTNRFFLGGGKALVNAYYDCAARLGVEVVYDTSIVDLEFANDGRCQAIEFAHSGERNKVPVRAVVVASGGLEANRSWLRATWGDAADNFIVRGTPDNDGSLLLSLLDNGARAAGDAKAFHGIAVDARAPRYDGGIVTRIDSIPFGVVVNEAGQRFYDEGEAAWPKRYAQWGQLVANQPGQIAYSIFDSKSWGMFIPSFYPPITAPSLGGLAASLRIDADALRSTVSTFNDAVEATDELRGSEADGPRTAGLSPPKSHWANPIDTPPFYGYPLRPGLTFTYLGLSINRSAQVIRSDGSPYGNLFATGELVAGNILNRGYLGGTGLTIGSVFGLIAGREAARA